VTASSQGNVLWTKHYKDNRLVSIEEANTKLLFDYSNGNISNVKVQTKDGRAFIYGFDPKSGMLEPSKAGHLRPGNLNE